MFSAEQKRYVYENSVKVNDKNKYIQIMAYYDDFFKKVKRNSIKRRVEFFAILLIILYLVCTSWLVPLGTAREVIFKISAIMVGVLITYKLGAMFLNYIDDLPIIKRIQEKECDLLCYTGILNDVTKFINYGSSANLQNYFMIVSGNKFQIDRKNYKSLMEYKGKEIKIYYFAELLQRQMYITDASIILV